ncbi:hypothetical protein GH984_02720 [Spiribacter sp. C176]|uniref:HNH nuclease domain-containing protein n=1 Tax=Spiribacter salilacus TaxID=2664894 RepID=A0A6N7QY55_9GAMM|nr:HNH endonuclease signature motif containing protein [Spiribacter salilacus]MRH77614.1 hypothetical protein [Spiribacter salilacus]
MAYWIFKVAEQDLYPDEPGLKYVYDNTHSVRVQKGDTFLYLDKTQGYSFTATGTVKQLSERKPTEQEALRTRKVRVVYTAHLTDVVRFTTPLSVSPTSKEGKRNRAQLGITDVNLLGWSQSMPSLGESMYQAILDLADLRHLLPSVSTEDFSVPDSWSKTKSRLAIKGFTDTVMKRSDSRCVVCGSCLPGLVEAAHLSPYATDVKNRANPANGICLCKYCHRALDLQYIAIASTGELLVDSEIDDSVATFHCSQISKDDRKALLAGVDPKFLNLTVTRHREYLSNKGMEARS